MSDQIYMVYQIGLFVSLTLAKRVFVVIETINMMAMAFASCVSLCTWLIIAVCV